MLTGWACVECDGRNPDGTRFCGWCGAPRAGAAAARIAAGGDRDERRLVTSLFADVSGFTSLADRLEADELHAVLSPVIAGMAGIAERYEGHMNKYAGDALLVSFGAPLAHEDDAARALLTALELHDALPGLAPDPYGRDLRLRVGVGTGRVVSGRFGGEARSDYSILGDDVNIAQRLEAAAEPGQTFVDEATYELTRHEFRFESLGELKLKGKLRPVPAYRLLGRRRLTAFSGVGLERPATPLVGRERELAEVWRVLDRLDGGSGGAVGLVADPGVGKSRLLGEIRDQAREAGVRWYQARCLSYGASLPYWPFADLVRQVTGTRPDDADSVVLTRLRDVLRGVDRSLPFLAMLLGLTEGTEHVRDLDPDAFRRGLHSAAGDLFGALGHATPIVLAIEDLHWADASSVALAVELAATTGGSGLAIVATSRPEGRDRLADIVAAADGVLLPLAPLGPEATAELLSHVLAGEPPEDLVALVADRTGGNPLFAEELVRALQEREVLTERNGHWRLRVGWAQDDVPETVERVLASRIDLLPASAAAALQLTAIAGRVVPRSLVDALLADVDDRATALDELLQRGLLEPTVYLAEPAVMFHHALVQEVAYGRLLPTVRRDLHRRVADVTERLYGNGDEVIELLARHLYLGGAGWRAVEALQRAADRAVRLYATDEAILHFGRAVEAAEESGLPTGPLVADLAEQQAVRGDYDEALRLFEVASETGGGVRAWCGRVATLRRRGEYDDAVAVADKAMRHVAGDGDALEAAALWLERGWTLSVAGDTAGAVAALEAGLEAAGERDEPVVGQLLAQLARVEALHGDTDKALGHAAAAQSLFERIDDLRGVALALRMTGNALGVAGRLDEAAAVFLRAIELAGRTGNVEELAGSLMNLGTTYSRRGLLSEAVDAYRRAIPEFERIDHGSGQAVGYGNLADALVKVGRLDEAEEWCNRALEKGRAIGHAATGAEGLHTLAEIRLAQGRTDEAADIAEQAAERFEEMQDAEGVTRCRDLADRARSLD